MRDTLFEKRRWIMHSGGQAEFKIECDSLTDEDLETLAYIVAQKGKISKVHGVPRGGIRFQRALEKHIQPGGVSLIVDDVLTTGKSMTEAKAKLGWSDAIGIVIFARGTCPNWIQPIFDMRFFNTKDKF